MGRLPAARPTPSTIRSRKRRAKLEARPKRAERPKERRASSRDEVRSSMRPVPAELDETLGPVAEELEAFAASCKREFDKARKARESASVIASLAASYRGALKALAELRPVDPAAVAESALAQSPQFRSFVAMIMETLARWSPNGYAAVTRALGETPLWGEAYYDETGAWPEGESPPVASTTVWGQVWHELTWLDAAAAAKLLAFAKGLPRANRAAAERTP
jgi:hypothetical protein